MIKRYILCEDYDKEFTLNDQSCRYYSKKKMKTVYPDRGYTVFGAVGAGLKNKAVDTFLMNEVNYSYYTLKYAKLQYGIVGYFSCGDDQYIAIVKSKLGQRLLLMLIAFTFSVALVIGGLQPIGDKIILDPNIGDYNPKIELPEHTDPTKIVVPGYQDITILQQSDELYLALWNPDTNPCYFKFTIEVIGSKEKLYESGLIPPGKAITTVKLNRKLEKGVYPVLIRMDTYSLKDGKTPMNGGSSKISIHVVAE